MRRLTVRRTVAVVALLAVAAGTATCTVTAGATCSPTPVPPTLSNTFEYEFTQIIPSEDATLNCVVAQDGPARKYAQMCSTTTGTFSSVLDYNRRDPMHHLVWTQLGETMCSASPLPPLPYPIPAPDYSVMNFSHVTAFGGDASNVFRYPLGRYAQSLFVDVRTQLPSMILSGFMSDVHARITTYFNGTVNQLRFDVPPNCTMHDGGSTQVAAAAAIPPAVRHVLFDASPAQVGMAADHPLRSTFGVEPEHASLVAATNPRWEAMPRTLPAALLRTEAVPAAVDNRRFYTPVRNQGLCGCCWSFSTAALSEAFLNIAANRTWVEDGAHWLAPQSLIDCVHVMNPSPHDQVPKGCFGGDPLDALAHVAAVGIATERTYPFTSGVNDNCKLAPATVLKPVASGALLPQGNITAMMAAIHQFGGVLAAINDNMAFNYWSGHGVFTAPCSPGFGHIVTLVGYGADDETGTPYWLVKNSYGAGWGDAGYVRIERGVNKCGIESYPFAGIPSPAVHT